MDKVQARFAQVVLGIDRNTPGYIWITEANRSNLNTEVKNRAGSYVAEGLEMK